MSKRGRNLLLLGALLAVAGVAVALILRFTEKPVEDDSISVLANARESVASVTVQNDLGSFTIRADESSASGYACDEVAGLPQLRSNYVSIVDGCASIAAAYAYENADPARYGLDDPRASCAVTLADGSSYTVSVGDRSPSENYCYFSVSTAPNTVYVTRESKFSSYFDDAYSLVNRLLAPYTGGSRPGNDETDTADWFEFTNAAGELFRLERIPEGHTDGAGNYYRYRQTSPVSDYVTAEAVQASFGRLMQFCASSVYLNAPDDAQRAACGLDEPLTVLRIGFGEDTAVIRLAAGPNGNYYAEKEGVDAIWIVADYLVTWLDTGARDLLTSYVAAPAMGEVTALDIEAYGERWSFSLADGAASFGGQPLDAAGFAALYKLACSVNSASAAQGEAGEAVVSIRFTLADGGTQEVLLSRVGSRSLAITADGRQTGLAIREAYAETLAAACEAVAAGETPSVSW